MIRGVRSPIQPIKKTDPSLGEIFDMLRKMNTMHQEIKQMYDFVREHAPNLEAKLTSIKQGPPGPQGFPGRDGNTPYIDHDLIAQKAASKIPVPKNGKDGLPGRNGKNPSPEEIIQLLFSPDRLDLQKLIELRLDPHIQNLRRLFARGGGDTVLTSDLSSQCNGTNKIFTIPKANKVVHLIGTDAPIVYRPTTDYTFLGTTLTLTSAVNAPSSGATLILSYA